MRLLLFLVLFLFLLGCTPLQTPEKGLEKETNRFNISLFDASHEDVFVPEKNKTLDKMSFIMQNNEGFDLDCSIILNISNKTDSLSKKARVGTLRPMQKKNVSLSFEMLYGTSSLNIMPECKKQ